MVQVYYMTEGRKVYMMYGTRTSYPLDVAKKVLACLLRRGKFGYIEEAK
jgi:hypothetical protein